MDRAQMRGECDRMQGLLEAYEARAVANSVVDHHDGLRLRLASLEQRLAELEGA